MSRPLLLLAAIALVSCGDLPVSTPVTDESWLLSAQWDDGQAEVAFYSITRPVADSSETIVAGTYLVKHEYDVSTESKAVAGGLSAFKSAFFYEFERGSYQYKYNWVTNAAQRDLSPLKASFSSFDWCSNAYREYLFGEDQSIQHVYRSDDYGNAEDHWKPQGTVYPAQLIPVLVRALDFSSGDSLYFDLLTPEGQTVPVIASRHGSEHRAGRVSQRIELSYSGPVPSIISGADAAGNEIWWRSMDEDRLLMGMEALDGSYRLDLVESLRSPYWSEDLYPRLNRVVARP